MIRLTQVLMLGAMSGAAGLALGGGVLGLLIVFGYPFSAASAPAAVPACFMTVTIAVHGQGYFGGWFPSRERQRLLILLYSCSAASVSMIVSRAVGFRFAVPAGVLLVVVSCFRYRHLVKDDPQSALRPTNTADLSEATTLIASCRKQLKDPQLSHTRRVNVKLNLAEQLRSRVVMTGSAGEDLPETDRLLTELIGDPLVQRGIRSRVASELCGTKNMLASMTGSTDGWQEALDRQLRLALGLTGGPERQLALAWAYDNHGQLHRFQMSRVTQIDGAGRAHWEVLRQAAIDCWTAALDVAPARSGIRAQLEMQIASVGLFEEQELGDADAAVDRLRSAHRIVRRLVRRHPMVHLELGVALVTRATLLTRMFLDDETGQDLLRRADADLFEAERVFVRLADSTLPIRGHAARELAQGYLARQVIREIRASTSDPALATGWGWASDPDDAVAEAREALRRFRQAFEVLREGTSTDATLAAKDWAAFAVELVDSGLEEAVDEAADAYQAMIIQFAVELERRSEPAELRRHASTMQGAAAEAGYWLARAGREAEALQAVESARAVLLTIRTRRLPGDLEQRLAAIGRADLFETYRRAERNLDDLERNQFDPATPNDPGAQFRPPPSRPDTSGAALTPIQLAWTTFQAVRQQVVQTLGSAPDDADGSTDITYLTRFAQVVYLLAAERGGYALISSQAGTTALQLPGLTAAGVAGVVQTAQELTGSDRSSSGLAYSARWTRLLTWLGAEAMGWVTAGWSSQQLLLIPLGALGSLPLHAAIVGERQDGRPIYANDVAHVRYGPNARMVADATRRLPRTPAVSLVALSVDKAPAGWHAPPLEYAAREADQVCRQFRGQTVQLHSPTLDTVITQLHHADVWHFACHGIADAIEPLNSALFLADQPLRLRRLMSLPPHQHRLAMLSACESNVLDPGQLDEVISFPGGLMRAGVSGVIASQWAINDLAAFLLAQRFYELWPGASEPHIAFTQAQRWVRDATWAELAPLVNPSDRHHRLPGSLPTGRMTDRPFADKPWIWAAFSYTGA